MKIPWSKPRSENIPDHRALDKTTKALIERISRKYQEACKRCEHEKADRYHWWLKYCHDVRVALNQMPNKKIPSKCVTILISSLLLGDLYQYLVDGSGNEKECCCTGVIDRERNMAIPTKLLPIELARQSRVFADGAVSSIYQTLTAIDNWAHPIALLCHCHPGCGVSSIYPSGTDMKTHKDIEVCYQAIGAIFSQDGYVRFFSAGKEFQVEIFGKGVSKVGDNVYRIED